MIVIPSLDLRGGLCAHAANPSAAGDSAATHPVSIARSWAMVGFRRLSVVDLDADGGGGSNAELIEDIIRDGALDIQTGGGVDSTDQIERFVDAGATRIVLGPRAIDEPRWLGRVAGFFPGLLVVSTDVRARRVVTRGWVRNLPLDILDIAHELDGLPLGGLLVSALASDSQRTAMDLALLEDVVEACAFPVLAAGGVSTMGDLRALEHRGVAGVLLGAALHSGELDARAIAQEYGG